MTATNHVLTGAIVAVSIKEPILAVPVALLSHYAMDALPHFGVSEDTEVRNRSTFFRVVVTIDTALCIASLITVPIVCRHIVAAWLILACMLAAFAPDIPWIYRFFQERRTKLVNKKHFLNRVHSKLQWGERRWGVLIEAIWLGWAITALSILR